MHEAYDKHQYTEQIGEIKICKCGAYRLKFNVLEQFYSQEALIDDYTLKKFANRKLISRELVNNMMQVNKIKGVTFLNLFCLYRTWGEGYKFIKKDYRKTLILHGRFPYDNYQVQEGANRSSLVLIQNRIYWYRPENGLAYRVELLGLEILKELGRVLLTIPEMNKQAMQILYKTIDCWDSSNKMLSRFQV